LKLFIIRHGQTDWNAEFRLQGQKDVPLNALGRSQAAANGVRLASLCPDLATFDFVSSPLSRARQTMELLRGAAGLAPDAYRLDERLIEISFGDWEGRTLKEIHATDPDSLDRRNANKWNFVPPGRFAESYEILSWRVGSWLKSIDRPTICTCHGGIVRSLFKLVANMDEDEAARLDVPQDRILEYRDEALYWL
jgi:probable phosphoglycerate mutase